MFAYERCLSHVAVLLVTHYGTDDALIELRGVLPAKGFAVSLVLLFYNVMCCLEVIQVCTC